MGRIRLIFKEEETKMIKELTDVTIILDRSGSMHVVKNDIIGSFNNFIKEQRKIPGLMKVSLVTFADDYKVEIENDDINKIYDLTDKNYQPSGSTALNDAIGKTINSVGQRLNDMYMFDRPGRVLIVIITDGEENASKEFSLTKVKEMIKHQEEIYSWEFAFIGADINVQKEATMRGVATNKSYTFTKDASSIKEMGLTLSASVATYRTGGEFKLAKKD